jgi:hypothetical protein
MQPYYMTYYTLIAVAIILSFVAFYKGHKRYFPILIVLTITEILELLVEVAIFKKIPFVWSYHIFVMIEFSLFSLYFRNIPSLLRFHKMISLSIPFFILVSLVVSAFYYHFNNLPAININIEGFVLFIFSTILLFNLETTNNENLLFNPDIWISVGISIFFGGTFFYNGIYSKLLDIDEAKAMELFSIINKPLNICFYFCIIIGLSCLILKKKYTIQ